MNIFEELSWALNGFINTETHSVAKAAYEIKEVTADFAAGKISKDEYAELVGDLLNLERITEQMDAQESKQEIAQALEMVKNAIGPLIGLILK